MAIPCGRYLVTLSISHWDQSPAPRIAPPLRLVNAARLVVADQPAASWELALQPGQDPAVRRDLWDEVTSAIGEQGGIDISTGDPDLNIVMFKCGMGDGAYPVWAGRAISQDPVCFVADLELLQHSFGPASG